MSYQISALDAGKFSHLNGLDEDSLAGYRAKRMRANTSPGFPCRVSLEDADIGESVLLLNYEHLGVDSPYRSAHAIFVREGATTCAPIVNKVPEQLRLRLLSIRAFDGNGMMVEADVVAGIGCEPAIKKLLATSGVDYLHIHYAKPGCYAARVDRC